MGTMMTHDVARATQRERADVPQPPATPSPPPRGPRSVPRETSRRPVVGLVLAVLLPPVGLAVSVAALVRAHREGRRSKVAVVGVAVAAAIIQVAVGYGALLAVRHLQDAEVTSARRAFEEYAAAAISVDCRGQVERTTAAFRQRYGPDLAACDDPDVLIARQVMRLASFVGAVEPPQVVDTRVDGDQALVRAVGPVGDYGVRSAVEASLVKHDGAWLVDDIFIWAW